MLCYIRYMLHIRIQCNVTESYCYVTDSIEIRNVIGTFTLQKALLRNEIGCYVTKLHLLHDSCNMTELFCYVIELSVT